MPTTPDTPTTEAGRLDVITSRFDLSDKRNLIGLGVMAFCLGVMVGARLMRGALPVPPESGGGVAQPESTERVVYVDRPGPVQIVKGDDCPECAEAKLQEQRARDAVAANQTPPPAEQRIFTVDRATEVPE